MQSPPSPREAGSPAAPDRPRRRRRGLSLVAFLLLWAGYGAAGLRFVDSRIYEADVFDADLKRVVHDMGRLQGTHYRTKVHPLFVLLLNPPGLLLKNVVHRPRVAAVLLDSAAGAAAVVLLWQLLLRLGLPPPRAGLWSLVFASSASQSFFAVLPETYAFSGASLLLLFLVFAAVPSRAARVAAGVVSFGVTLTNVVAGVVLAFACAPAAARRRIRRALLYGTLVLAATVPLSLLQKRLYPQSETFFRSSSVSEEADYVFRPRTAGDAARRAASVANELLFANLAARAVRLEPRPDEPPAARFDGPRPAGWVHAVLWAALCAVAASGLARRATLRQPIVQGLLLWVGFNAALHLVYGQELFLYSCHWTFAVLALAAVGLEAAARGRRPASLAVVLVAALQLWTNAGFLLELRRLYG